MDLNGTQAAIRAGYSPKTARVIAAENLTKPNIQQAIRRESQSLAERAGVHPEQVLRDLKLNAAMALGQKPIHDGSRVYKPEAANRSLELLGKHLRLWGEDASSESTAKLVLAELQALARRSAQGRVVDVEARVITAEEQVALALNPPAVAPA